MNKRLNTVGDYPFDRLRTLLESVEPPNNIEPIALSVGEPQHRPPSLLPQIVAKEYEGWAKYPPMKGTKVVRDVIAEWLARRYGLPQEMINPETMLVPVSGTREALFLMALAAVPAIDRGPKPIVLMPNPFYQVYLGAAIMAGAEPVLVPADQQRGFLPDYGALSKDILARTVLAYYCSPANPQGTVASAETMEKLVLLARAFDFLLVSDECYSELYYAEPPTGAAEACARIDGSLKNVVIMNS